MKKLHNPLIRKERCGRILQRGLLIKSMDGFNQRLPGSQIISSPTGCQGSSELR